MTSPAAPEHRDRADQESLFHFAPPHVSGDDQPRSNGSDGDKPAPATKPRAHWVVLLMVALVLVVFIDVPILFAGDTLRQHLGVPPLSKVLGKGTAHITSCSPGVPILGLYDCAADVVWDAGMKPGPEACSWLRGGDVTSTRPLSGEVRVTFWCETGAYKTGSGTVSNIEPTDQAQHPERGWWVWTLIVLGLILGTTLVCALTAGVHWMSKTVSTSLRRLFARSSHQHG